MSTVNKVLAEARKHLGYYRKPGTATVFGQWYADQVGGRVYITAQWCAIFISYIASAAGASKIIPLHAYTPSGVTWWKAQKQWHNGLSGVRAGDVVYFNFGSLGRVSHVGIVESVNSDGSVNTIEGNTSSTAGGDQRNSGTCARKRRKAYIVGYGRPAYTTAPAGGSGSTSKTIAQMADEVLARKHGDGHDTRRKSLGVTAAVYEEVRAEVNRRAGKPAPKPPAKPTPAPPKPPVPGWFTVTATTLNGRSGPSLKHRVKTKRARGFHLYIAKTVKGGDITWAVTNYGTYYSMAYLKKGKN